MKTFKTISTTVKNSELVRERQEQIFQAALRLFSKKGYHLTSLRQLSKQSGIGLSNIYDYIGEKSDILYLLYQKLVEMTSQATDKHTADAPDPAKQLEIMMEAELQTLNRYQDLAMVVYQESHGMKKPSMRAMLSSEEMHIGRFKKVLEEGIESGVFSPCNTTAVSFIIMSMIDCWVLKRWGLRKKVTLEQMKESIMKIVKEGILIR